MRLDRSSVKKREEFVYSLFTSKTPEGEPVKISVREAQARLRLPENGGKMMSPGRIYQIRRAAEAGAGLPPTNSLAKAA